MIPEDNEKKQKNNDLVGLIEWLTQCLSCKHCYTKQDDDLLYCRRNGKCKYEKKELTEDE